MSDNLKMTTSVVEQYFSKKRIQLFISNRHVVNALFVNGSNSIQNVEISNYNFSIGRIDLDCNQLIKFSIQNDATDTLLR